ncbi:hypothetical protein MLD38_030405 [Melastoma candidum]|uniref:Uncharacterized protein n=1 Tax=Melastoma candidum TaxID=119954 RepID=A0ACB9MRS5_9MYRT|nr:hypothetical protein MLD38_030405 [Melastoma candidum]
MEAILKLPDLRNRNDRQKAMETSSRVSGIDYISVNMEDRVLTATGDFDPIQLLEKLKQLFSVKIVQISTQGKFQRIRPAAGDTEATVKLNLHDEKDKQKAMKIVLFIPGVYRIRVNMKDGKLSAKGNFESTIVVDELKKHFAVKLLSASTAEDEKKGNNHGGNKKGNNHGGNKKGDRLKHN